MSSQGHTLLREKSIGAYCHENSKGDIQLIRVVVALRTQRLAIMGLWLLLAAFTYAFSSGVIHFPAWAGALLAGAVSLLFYGLINKTSPNSPVPFIRGADYIGRGFLKAAVPVIAMVLAYVLAAYFGQGEGGTQVAAICALVIGGIFYVMTFPASITEVVGSLVRGRAQPVHSSESLASQVALPTGDTGITWGGLRIPSSEATSHFMVVGTTGSGKSVTLQLLMQEALSSIGGTNNNRALVYDAKQDIIAKLVGMNLACEIKTLNPFDERCVAWDIASDITEPATALQAAATLLPRDVGSSQPFFVDAAQTLLYGVMLAFIQRGSDWRFSDLIRAMQDVERLKKLLRLVPESEHIAKLMFENEDTLNNVMTTVATKMLAYEPIAAMWDFAYDRGQKISLNEWVEDRGAANYVLILGNSERARKPLDALNQVIFKRVSELLLDQDENVNKDRFTWIFLDELAEAGRLDGLTSLLAKGRSKGVSVVIGFQDIEGLRAVYGEKETNALTGQCNNKAILRIESPPTGEWASKLFGSYEAIEIRKSTNQGTSRERGAWLSGTVSESTNYAEEYVQRQAVLESQFSTIPVTSPANGLGGYYIVPSVGTYKHTYAGDWLFGGKALAKAVGDVANLASRNPHGQFLRPWVSADYVRLKFPELEPLTPATPAQQAAMGVSPSPAPSPPNPSSPSPPPSGAPSPNPSAGTPPPSPPPSGVPSPPLPPPPSPGAPTPLGPSTLPPPATPPPATPPPATPPRPKPRNVRGAPT